MIDGKPAPSVVPRCIASVPDVPSGRRPSVIPAQGNALGTEQRKTGWAEGPTDMCEGALRPNLDTGIKQSRSPLVPTVTMGASAIERSQNPLYVLEGNGKPCRLSTPWRIFNHLVVNVHSMYTRPRTSRRHRGRARGRSYISHQCQLFLRSRPFACTAHREDH